MRSSQVSLQTKKSEQPIKLELVYQIVHRIIKQLSETDLSVDKQHIRTSNKIEGSQNNNMEK